MYKNDRRAREPKISPRGMPGQTEVKQLRRRAWQHVPTAQSDRAS